MIASLAVLSLIRAGEAPAFFGQVAALVVTGAAIAYISSRFGLVPIVGFLLAGVVIGPNALGLVKDIELVNSAADLGVVLLLFTIGIEFSLERLARIQRLIFAGGGLQVVLGTLATCGLLMAFGVGWRPALYTGFLVSLSSTAIVLKLLADRGATNDTHGQIGIAVLIFQDLAIIAMVLVVPMLSGTGGSVQDIGWALGKAVLLIVGVLVIARRLMPPVLEAVARTCAPELFLLAVIAICVGTAYLTSLAGVSLSLGAFLGGLIVSESSFSEHALGEIMPLQILFSATFFVSVGMLLDLSFLMHNLPFVLAAVAAVLIVKAVTTGASVLALGYELPVAYTVAFMLAQVGEFSFVLEKVGRGAGLYPAGLAGSGSQTFIAATVTLMVLTPFLLQAGERLGGRAASARKSTASATMLAKVEELPVPAEFAALENHVIVAGYGAAARKLVRVLSSSGVPFVITTLSPAGANEAERDGMPVLRGDSSRLRTLQHVGIEKAKMLVIADDDPAQAGRIAIVARTANPTMRVVVRTRYMSEAEPLTRAGSDRVITEELESIVQTFADVLSTYHIPSDEILAYEEAIRAGNYRALEDRREAARLDPCRLDADCLDTRIVTVRSGGPAANRALGELDLDRRFGIGVRAIHRDGVDIGEATPDFVLQPGDELRLAGTAEAFARSGEVFRGAGETGVDDGAAVATAVAPATKSAIDVEQTIELVRGPDSPSCPHIAQTRPVHPSANGCEECLRTGDRWVHLRICMTCGHVGCCDSSPNRHATKHFHATTHPIMRSIEPGEDWAWCYEDRLTL